MSFASIDSRPSSSQSPDDSMTFEEILRSLEGALILGCTSNGRLPQRRVLRGIPYKSLRVAKKKGLRKLP